MKQAGNPREAADRLVAEGQAHEASNRVDLALRSYMTAQRTAPDHLPAALHVGIALEHFGRVREALQSYTEIVAMSPDYAPAHFNLGSLLLRLRRIDEATVHLRSAWRLRPTMVEAAILLAEISEANGKRDESEALLRSALAVAPGHAGAAVNLGHLLLEQGRMEEAEQLLTAAQSTADTALLATLALGHVYSQSGRPADAERQYRRAVDLDPRNTDAVSGLLFALNLRSDIDAKAVFEAHRLAGGRFGTPGFDYVAGARRTRLRIGYVSGDLGQHPVGLFLRPVVRHHDRTRFEIVAYHDRAAGGPIVDEIKSCVDTWHQIESLNDDAFAALVQSEGIDIIVDLAGHGARNRLRALAKRLAPVQATWLGYLNTTGLPAMHWRICDVHTDPPGETEHLHTEKLARLPAAQWCYNPVFDIAPRSANAKRPSGEVVFGAFNQYGKVSDACLDAWCAILARLPRATLVVHGVPQQSMDHARERFRARGVGDARVALKPRVDVLTYFNAIAQTDIALDTFPYNGATTTLDCLWMNVPVVALRGDRSISRSSYSILTSMGQGDLVTRSVDDYVARNVRLAQEPGQLNELHATLRGRLLASPLADARRFTRDLEALYDMMWERIAVAGP